jgi:hypothetical protein
MLRIRPVLAFLCALCASVVSLALLPGCTVGPVIDGPAGASDGSVANTAANVSEWDSDGNVRAVLQGGFPAQIETGPTGANIQASGQPRVLTFSITTADGTQRVATLADPSDTELSGFEMLPDGTIRLATFGAVASKPLDSQVPAILASLEATGAIAAEQAETARAAIAAGADVATVIAGLVKQAVLPGP